MDTQGAYAGTCPQGHEVAADARFCSFCGAAVVVLEPEVSMGLPTGPSRSDVWRMRLPWVLVGSVVALALIVLIVLQPWKNRSSANNNTSAQTASSSLDTVTIYGQFYLFDEGMRDCNPSAGYSDVGSGTPVTLRDESGTVIGSGTLGMGRQPNTGSCVWGYSLTTVPTNVEYYTLTVGRRGDITYSRSEMISKEWKLQTSLGDR